MASSHLGKENRATLPFSTLSSQEKEGKPLRQGGGKARSRNCCLDTTVEEKRMYQYNYRQKGAKEKKRPCHLSVGQQEEMKGGLHNRGGEKKGKKKKKVSDQHNFGKLREEKKKFYSVCPLLVEKKGERAHDSTTQGSCVLVKGWQWL